MTEKAQPGDVVVLLDEPLPDGTMDTNEYTVVDRPSDLIEEESPNDTFLVDDDNWIFLVFPEEYRIVRKKEK